MLKTGQTSLHRFASYTWHPGTSLSGNPVIVDVNPGKIVAKLEDDTAQTGVIKEQISPLADDNQGDLVTIGKTDDCSHLVGTLRFNQKISRAADPPAVVFSKRRIENTSADVSFHQLFELL